MTRIEYAAPGEWADDAACLGTKTMHLPDKPRRKLTKQYLAAAATARIMCNGCPVIDACFAWAMTDPDPAEGLMAGGMTPPERDALRRQPVTVDGYKVRDAKGKFVATATCGSASRYKSGCRCDGCRAAHTLKRRLFDQQRRGQAAS